MANLGTRISNVIFWLCIVATAGILTVGAYVFAEHLVVYKGAIDWAIPMLTLGAAAVVTAVWVIAQHLITGQIALMARGVVIAVMLAGVIGGGLFGHSEGVRRKASDDAYYARIEAEKRSAEMLEEATIKSAGHACAERYRVFRTAFEENDKMALDLYTIYAKCMSERGVRVSTFGYISTMGLDHMTLEMIKR